MSLDISQIQSEDGRPLLYHALEMCAVMRPIM